MNYENKTLILDEDITIAMELSDAWFKAEKCYIGKQLSYEERPVFNNGIQIGSYYHRSYEASLESGETAVFHYKKHQGCDQWHDNLEIIRILDIN